MIKVQVITSNDIENKESLERWATEHLSEHLARFEQDITSILVSMTDENHAAKGGGLDKRCMMEARVNGREPVAVTTTRPSRTSPSAAPPTSCPRRSTTSSASSTAASTASARPCGATRRCWRRSPTRRPRADASPAQAGAS